MNLIICGPPGSGKGTQARKISEFYSIPAISTGDLLREAIEKRTKLGIRAKKYVSKGRYVPDQLVNIILKERLKKRDCKRGFVLDGYPRTLKQAFALDKILDSLHFKSRLVVFLEIAVKKELIIKRIVYRRVCPKDGSIYNLIFKPPKKDLICDICGTKLIQREDDREDVVNQRIKEYLEKTKPVIEYYRKKGMFISVNGEKSVDEVFKEIIEVLKRFGQ